MCCILRYILQYVLKYITIQYNWIWSMTYNTIWYAMGFSVPILMTVNQFWVYDNMDVKNKVCHKIKKKMKQKIIKKSYNWNK